MTGTLSQGASGVGNLDRLYPDGEPLPESAPHELVRHDAATVLRQYFSTHDDVFVGSNLNVYHREGDVAAVVEPDVLVVADVAAAQLRGIYSYRTFQHGGAVLFVLEVLESDSFIAEMAYHRPDEARREDLDYKRHAYAAIGVAELWCVDPTGGDIAGEVLTAERLTDGRWAPIEVTVDDAGTWRAHSDSLNLDIAWRDRELLFYPPRNDQPLPDLARAVAARQEAETAHRAERNARLTAETAHRTERVLRRAEQEALQAAERKVEAQAEEIVRQATEIARLKELLRRNGGPADGRPHDPPG